MSFKAGDWPLICFAGALFIYSLLDFLSTTVVESKEYFDRCTQEELSKMALEGEVVLLVEGRFFPSVNRQPRYSARNSYVKHSKTSNTCFGNSGT